jgi:hypothetical protein
MEKAGAEFRIYLWNSVNSNGPMLHVVAEEHSKQAGRIIVLSTLHSHLYTPTMPLTTPSHQVSLLFANTTFNSIITNSALSFPVTRNSTGCTTVY